MATTLTRLYNQVGNTLNDNAESGNVSPVYATHKFKLEIDKSCLVEEEKNSGIPLEIHGITEELPSISYSTGWDISPVATLTKKVEEFTQHKLIRSFAETNADYRPPLFTDGWTQKMPKEGSTLSVDLSFRGYPVNNLYNASYYKTILQFLFFTTTPREYNTLDAADYIRTGLAGAEAKGRKLGVALDILKNSMDSSDGNGGIMHLAKIVATDRESLDIAEQAQKDAYNQLMAAITDLQAMSDANTGGAPLCTFELGNMIHSVPTIKWLIKTWAFKPAVNVTYDEENKSYEPIYVDFKVSLETQMVLTADEIAAILNGNT